MADVTPTKVDLSGVTPPTPITAEVSNRIVWGRGLEIEVANTHTSDIVATIVKQVADSQGVKTNITFTVPLTSGVMRIGPIPKTYADGLGYVHLNLDDATAATIYATYDDVTVL